MKNLWLIIDGIVFLLIGVFIGWSLFSGNKQTNDNTQLPPGWEKAYAEQQQDIAKWKTRYEQARDTANRLAVEKGRLEIENNQSEAKIDRYVSAYNDLRNKINDQHVQQPHFIDAALLNCDSIVDEWHNNYLSSVRNKDLVVDSLNRFYEVLLAYKDSAIATCDSSARLLEQNIAVAQAAKTKAEKDKEKIKKKAGIGWIAAAIASIIALGSSIFN
jgi:hypothetical protein